jgi:hypothetical protein
LTFIKDVFIFLLVLLTNLSYGLRILIHMMKKKEFVKMVLGLTENSIGMASFSWDSAGGIGAVLIPKMHKNPKETAALIHELMHATFWVLDLCHVDYDPNGSNEAFTYLMEHLTRNALEKEGYKDVVFKI